MREIDAPPPVLVRAIAAAAQAVPRDVQVFVAIALPADAMRGMLCYFAASEPSEEMIQLVRESLTP